MRFTHSPRLVEFGAGRIGELLQAQEEQRCFLECEDEMLLGLHGSNTNINYYGFKTPIWRLNMPKVNGVLETALYVEDLERSAKFYQSIFGFGIIGSDPGRLTAMNVAGRQVLLLFKKGASITPKETTGGIVPPTDGSGTLHLAFSVPASELAGWEEWLAEKEVPVESKISRETGTQLYFRDPDRHVIELITVPGAWGIF